MLTTRQVLDRALTRIRDNSPAMRVKMLAWLNSVMQDVVNEPRDWTFLHRETTLTLTGGVATLPADFSGVEFMQVGLYAFTPSDNLTPYAAAVADEAGGDPVGYTLDATSVTIHPTTSGSLRLSYKAEFPEAGYEDNTETMFPVEWLPVFERVLVAGFYEYDVDSDRMPVGLQISADQMRKMKILDNRRKPVPPLDPRGLVRAK